MKRSLIVLFFLLTIEAYGQIPEFYNGKGQLIADTNYTYSDITNPPSFGGLSTEFIYSIISRVRYPWYEVEIAYSGLVIFEITLKKNDSTSCDNIGMIENIKFAKKTDEKDLSPQLIEDFGFLKTRFFRFKNRIKKGVSYKFYIPIMFISNSGNEHKIEKYYKNGVIVFKSTIIPFVIH